MIDPKNILIVRSDRIGDVVLTIPVAKIIKEKYPNCKITFMVKSYTRPLVENHKYIDEIITIVEKGNELDFSENLRIIKEKNFDYSIIVNPTFQTAKLLYKSGIRNRIGTGYRLYSFLFNKRVFEHRKDAKRHELEYNVNLLQKLNISYDANINNVDFDLFVDATITEKLKANLSAKNIYVEGKKHIIIHPGSGGSAVDLPKETLMNIVKELSEIEDYSVWITGSPQEKEMCNEFVVGERVFNLAGKYDLNEFKSLIFLSEMLIANSTGPIHIAAALDKNVVGFYPKIRECSHKRWGPYTIKKAVFTPNLDCSDCNRKQCEELDCMKTIESNKVIESINDLITN